MKIPNSVPESGFYYHYKHDPNGPINNYAYEVVGIGFHTEDDARPGEAHFLNYRPIYECDIYKASKESGILYFYSRPLSMFIEEVTKEGKTFPRFQKINDPVVIAQLQEIKRQMYGSDIVV